MYIGIKPLELLRHIPLLRQELQQVEYLQEEIDFLYLQSNHDPWRFQDQLERALSDIDLLKQSITWRIGFLENLAYDFRRIAEENSESLQK